MAESSAKGDDDVVELPSPNCSLSMEEFRHMITRHDWFDLYKSHFEGKKPDEPKTQSDTEEPVVVPPSLPLEKKTTRRSSAKDVDHTYVPPQKNQRKTRANSCTNDANDTSAPPENSRKKTNTRGARRGRRGRNTRCNQPDTTDNQQETVPEVVQLDSDNEIEIVGTRGVHRKVTRSSARNHNVEVILVNSDKEEEEEEESEIQNEEDILIFFCWKNKVLKHPMKQTTKFGTILSSLSVDWQIQGSDITLVFNDKIINPDDSPGTLAMLSGTIVDCSVVKSQTTLNVEDPNVITIKLQNKYSRDKKSMVVHKMKDFQFVIEQYAREEGIPADKIVFKFDGDVISPTDTPFSLGMEPNDSIDVTY